MQKPTKPDIRLDTLRSITQDEHIRRTRANRALAALRSLAARWMVLGGHADELANLCGLTTKELGELTGVDYD